MSTLAASFGLRLSERATGVALAFATACVSGVAVYVNAKGVARFDDATVYTTAKDAVAGLALLALAAPLLATRPRTVGRAAWPGTGRQRLGVVTIAVIGGSVPFVLFFEGLARASATQAAFIHKTLVLWVAVLAVVLLRERLGRLHVLAIGLLMAGQVLLVPSLGVVTFGAGEAMILGATLLWAVEVILVKRLVTGLDPRTLAAARMGLGTLLLIAWVAVTGRGSELLGLDAGEWGWAVLTGALLAAYVATWYAALARAQAVDVTAVLVFGAVVTAALSGAFDGVALDGAGLAVVTLGAGVAAAAALRRSGPRAVRT
ncbi:MAG TPA: EamA family transporter [Gaiella sp.]|nr:EamA family transporter [Gaiella sp.]